MGSDIAFTFHIYIPWDKTLSLVPKSRSSVICQGQSQFWKNNGRCGGTIVFFSSIFIGIYFVKNKVIITEAIKRLVSNM